MTEQQHGILASGNLYTVTAHEVTITAPDGVLTRHTMTHDLVSVGRDGTTVRTRDIHGRPFDMQARSEQEASVIERVLLLTVPAEQRPPRFQFTQVQAGIAACVVLALLFGGFVAANDPQFWDIFRL